MKFLSLLRNVHQVLDPGLFHHIVAYYQRNQTKCWEREGEGERKGRESGR